MSHATKDEVEAVERRVRACERRLKELDGVLERLRAAKQTELAGGLPGGRLKLDGTGTVRWVSLRTWPSSPSAILVPRVIPPALQIDATSQPTRRSNRQSRSADGSAIVVPRTRRAAYEVTAWDSVGSGGGRGRGQTVTLP